jgi:hypothetical protein
VAFGSAHATPHAPQFVFVLRLVSHPFAYCPSQSEKPALHDATTQVEFMHAPVPFATVQAVPHAPQFMGSFVRLVVQPVPEQLPRPAEHEAKPHTPATQLGVPPVDGQTWPHAPQLFTSAWRFASQPFAGRPSQLP